MPRTGMTNMHLPLLGPIYSRLRAEARRSGRPATEMGREAIDRWLAEQQPRRVHEEILAYAAEAGGSLEDLDPEIEAAGIERLLRETEGGGTYPWGAATSTGRHSLHVGARNGRRDGRSSLSSMTRSMSSYRGAQVHCGAWTEGRIRP